MNDRRKDRDMTNSTTNGPRERSYPDLAAEQVAETAMDGPVAVDPDIAEHMGAFEETALDDDSALDAWLDGDEPWMNDSHNGGDGSEVDGSEVDGHGG